MNFNILFDLILINKNVELICVPTFGLKQYAHARLRYGAWDRKLGTSQNVCVFSLRRGHLVYYFLSMSHFHSASCLSTIYVRNYKNELSHCDH